MRRIALTIIASLFVVSLAAAQQTTHTVQRGENLQSIAEFYGVSVMEIQRANTIVNPNYIQAGMQIVIPVAPAPVQPAPHPNPVVHPPAPQHPAPAQPTTFHYTIKYGDTFSVLAMQYNTTVAEIRALNGLTPIDINYPGDVILMPVNTVMHHRPMYHQPVHHGRVYVVQQGDTLLHIASRYGVSAFAIAEANGIFNLNRIFTGQALIIPS